MTDLRFQSQKTLIPWPTPHTLQQTYPIPEKMERKRFKWRKSASCAPTPSSDERK